MIWQIIIWQVYLLFCILFLAGKDATSYRLKDHNADGSSLINSRIKRWHRDGVALWVLVTIPVAYFVSPWLIVYSATIRGSVFDLGFNVWAGLPTKFLGGSAWFDRLHVKLFGKNGAYVKSLAYAGILIALNVILEIYAY